MTGHHPNSTGLFLSAFGTGRRRAFMDAINKVYRHAPLSKDERELVCAVVARVPKRKPRGPTFANLCRRIVTDPVWRRQWERYS